MGLLLGVAIVLFGAKILFLIAPSLLIIFCVFKIANVRIKAVTFAIFFVFAAIGLLISNSQILVRKNVENIGNKEKIIAYGKVDAVEIKDGYQTLRLKDASIKIGAGVNSKSNEESKLNTKSKLSTDSKLSTNSKSNTEIYVQIDKALSENDEKTIYAGTILIYGDDFGDLKIGNKVLVRGENKELNVARNPGNFDPRDYYNSLGIYTAVNCKSYEITDNSVDFISEGLRQLRNKAKEIISNVTSDKAGTISAIVLGDKSDLDKDTKSKYQISGISHILAVSGLHVSIIGMGLYKIFRKQLGFKASAIFSGIIMCMFSILCDNGVSVMRAVIMFDIRLLKDVTGKRYDILSSISFAAISLILINPFYLINGSFLMSFMAVTSVALFGNLARKVFETNKKLVNSMLASLFITLGTAPIVVNMFHEISLYSVLLNIIVIPLMSFVLATGIFAAIVGFLSVLLAKLIVGIGYYILSFYDVLCTIFEMLPFHSIVVKEVTTTRIIIFYVMFFALYGIFRFQKIKKCFKKSVIIIVSVVLILAMLFTLKGINKNDLEMIFMDVGQGDGILIMTNDGKNILIDSGSTDIKGLYENRLEGCIKSYGVKTLDYVFVSHGDNDHINGIIEILKNKDSDRIKINHLVLQIKAKNNEVFDELVSAAKASKIKISYVKGGDELSLKDINFKVLYPNENTNAKDENDNSMVLYCSSEACNVLFTGDLSAEGEKTLLNSGVLDNLEVDILKVGHHGSKNSSSEEFLKKIKPKYGIISAGINNSYGHPNKETLERLEKVDTKLYCTKDLGAIIVNSDGIKYEIRGYLQNK